MALPEIPPLYRIERALVARGGLRQFARLAFPEVEPRTFLPNWHVDAICEHLEAVSRGQIRNLVINIPPGCMKSLLVGVFWPAWAWIQDPAHKWIFASYSGNLTRRDAIRNRNLINSEWYQSRWGYEINPENGRPDTSKPRADRPVCIPWQNTRAAMFYENNHKGFRFSTSVGGEVTGRHANSLVIDDPTKAQAASEGRASSIELEKTRVFWTETMATRQADPTSTRRVIIMQRLHELDLAGAMLKGGGYEFVRLPMEYDPRRPCVTSLGRVDPRTEPGQLLWPARYRAEDVAELRRTMGPKGAAAQLDQDPTPDGGSIFEADWLLNEWREVPGVCRYTMSVDCAFKGEADSDYVVIQVWAHTSDRYYLVDQYRARLSFPATVQAILDMRAKWPKVSKILIEDKANGPAVISVLKKRLPYIKPINPEGGKEARANAVVYLFANDRVFLPPESIAPWVGEYRQELARFPRGANDDQVDATTQYLLDVAGSSFNKLSEAMERLKAR